MVQKPSEETSKGTTNRGNVIAFVLRSIRLEGYNILTKCLSAGILVMEAVPLSLPP